MYIYGPAGSPTCTVYVDLTLTRSKVNVKVTGLLNFRQLAKPCMLAAMTAAPCGAFWLLGHRLGDDLVDWNSGVSVRPYVRTSVRPYVHKKFFRFRSNSACG